MRYSRELALVAVMVLVVFASAMDFYMDLSHGSSISHIVKEGVIVVLAGALIVRMVMEHFQQVKEIEQLKDELAATDQHHEAMSDYVLKMRNQLSDVVSHQFDDWQLTTSEKEVGWLLLKGLSLKEIAVLRDTLEKTVRQQASAIYRKAGVSGRHAFSAWFIEDLL